MELGNCGFGNLGVLACVSLGIWESWPLGIWEFQNCGVLVLWNV